MSNKQTATSKKLETIRHSAAHVLAMVVIKLYPGAKPTIGPTIKEGFYYDFSLPKPISEEDLPKIEEEIKKIIAAKLSFKRTFLTRAEARKYYRDNPFKLELISDIEGEKISFYQTGEFLDLCRGPHVSNTGKIGAFKLTHLAGAYWRGSEKNPMLTRIYGTVFPTKEKLVQYLKKVEEAGKRDHRTLGAKLDLFSINEEVGPGLILWHPKGALIRTILEDYWREKHKAGGYQFVFTPHIGRSVLWERSGHLKWFKENMYSAIDVEGDEYYLKPMNCPFHMMIYKSQTRSYRDLPLRLAELGTVYRFERSGVLHGMTRVRGFTQDDAHIFCTPNQIEEEITKTLKFCLDFLKVFGLTLSAELSVRDPTTPQKYAGSNKDWQMAESVLIKALKAAKLPFKRMEGEAIFYGPKIDLKAYDALDRPWQTSTIQFDFNLPERFNLCFINERGEKQTPYMVHRALYGSLERFFPILVEHFAGALPVWLAPLQVMIIPITKDDNQYGMKVEKKLKEIGLRVELDSRSETMQAKIRDAQLQKVPYMLIVGEKERKAGTVSERGRSGRDYGQIDLDKFISNIKKEIENKSLG
ncbi:threonine--tRNA ligase [candidate division WWE3 bacterium CG09_land_8_20_14_0_10_47_33]|uniref:Threonine--tRNA ligase n=1 Tax=candidate division WWE3 bacterium CG_4_9_14_0_2_um_filter_48_10 TaxID=1975078 RepID=A0A2M8EI56_UNCKA|nr:MAG: threonine--tRNA ligase [candidate division WWE3 bacterium CG09_land_8_20_14_0_10_47_33]PIZ40739.1 MAG: threonine--tRNA ligase [candidate division WWE3 bacterium CG_4_10_14_0_2_um_filter_47_8]PJC22165.1 MAG: threonine--tRNA ligase [candidate division WWE3 bacterium CG_4_9_14_0_2_um_filter_48_10]PJE52353.1 MAG: threonine--tRNA ligase [candidate division WWE3 bacterium CG10_big_fil_rev_8_21_14_0_10_48_23]